MIMNDPLPFETRRCGQKFTRLTIHSSRDKLPIVKMVFKISYTPSDCGSALSRIARCGGAYVSRKSYVPARRVQI